MNMSDTTVRSRGITFTGHNVPALIADTKTRTRRLMNPQPVAPDEDEIPDAPRAGPYFDSYCSERKTPENPRGMSNRWHWWTADNRLYTSSSIRCPYGKPGDQLWVRETFTHITGNGVRMHYKADGEPRDRDGNVLPTEPGLRRWTSPLFMPRESSRVTLAITEIRAERLQAITEDEARAEGVEPFFTRYAGIGRDQVICWNDGPDGPQTVPELARDAEYRASFACVWDEINGDRALWSSNPWVWVLGFRRVPSPAPAIPTRGRRRS